MPKHHALLLSILITFPSLFALTAVLILSAPEVFIPVLLTVGFLGAAFFMVRFERQPFRGY